MVSAVFYVGQISALYFLRIDSETFTLRCPPSYPNYDTTQDNFFVEAPSCLQLWGNALNEFLLDSRDQLNLISILTKGCSLYSSKDRTEMMDFDDNSDREEDDEYGEEEEEEDEEEEEEIGPEDYHLDDMLDKDLNWELEVRSVIIQVQTENSLQVAKRKKKWKAREDELRAEKSEKLESSSSSLYGAGADTAKGRQPKQIFSSTAASGVLTNDLVDIMQTVKETGKKSVLLV